jgi:predicted nucleic acid-binding protein
MRILLDTSFLLPIVGVRVREVESALHKLWNFHKSGGVKLYYTDLNMLEIAWKLSRLNYDPSIVEIGLRSIERSMVKVETRAPLVLRALELRRRGFDDMVDLLLYLTAKDNNLLFLTLDRALVEFLESVGEDTSMIITSI